LVLLNCPQAYSAGRVSFKNDAHFSLRRKEMYKMTVERDPQDIIRSVGYVTTDPHVNNQRILAYVNGITK
jgi:hypothetical protein